jgi:RNA polymerase sigma factor (sigma-70 family)
MDERTDKELVTITRAGNTDAFCLLVERYQPLACAIAFRLVTDQETVQEVVQEATLQAYLSLDHLRNAAHFKQWFYGIVLNVCHTWLREQKTYILSLEALDDHWQGTSPSSWQTISDPYEIIDEWELRRIVQEAVQDLSPKNRVATWLFYYEQLSVQEIASRLEISLTAVRNRLHKGRNELRRRLAITYPDVEQRQKSTSGRQRRKIMIQVTLVQVLQQPRQVVAVLLDAKGQRFLPLWLRDKEGRILLEHPSSQPMKFPFDSSPIPIDLMDQLLNAMRDAIEEVRIEALQDNLLYTIVQLRISETLHEIKARVGAGLGVAARVGCPIYVTEEIFNTLAISLPTEGGTPEQKLERLVQTLSRYVPASPLITQTSGMVKQPQNLDFQEGVRGWQFHGGGEKADGKQFNGALECEIDPGTTYQGHVVLTIKMKEDFVKSKGGLRQEFLANDYRGKRIRFSGFLKTQDFGEEFRHLGLWLTIEGLNETLYTANTQEQPVSRTQDWTRQELEVYVPDESITIEFGLFIGIAGHGQAWLSDVQFETVQKNVSPPAM